MADNRYTYKKIDPEIERIVAGHGVQKEGVLEIFQEIQEQKGGVTREAIHDVATALRLPDQRAFEVASFYSMISLEQRTEKTVRICDGPVCWFHGSDQVRQAADSQLATQPGWRVERTSCLGLCDRAPAAMVDHEAAGPLTPENVDQIPAGFRGERQHYSQAREGELRVMLAGTGKIDAESIESAIEHGAYRGLAKALNMAPQAVLGVVESSGLTGRGGAGFPVGRKWRFVAQEQRSPKYVVCNADESEPLIFKDRVLISTNPQQLLEGMIIAGYSVAAEHGFIYIRGEYERHAARLDRAIAQAKQAGWLGDNIKGSGFSFHINVHRGAGAYICGEETALLESLESKRGEPRLRPPYPPTFGYKGMPTMVNNVESFSAVPAILENGADWYRSLSSYATPGTKLYMLLGHVNRPGLFEAPFGLTLRQVIEDFGGGMPAGSNFQFALTGGAAGTIVGPALLDTPIDYSSAAKGISLGAGAFLICDERVSPVEFLRVLLHFFKSESCGKCTPCRVGTTLSFDILDRLTKGEACPGDLDELTNLAGVMQIASLCGLGQSVAIPVKSALATFPGEFKAAAGIQP